VSRASRLETPVFPGKTGGFAAEVVGFELGGDVLKLAETSFMNQYLKLIPTNPDGVNEESDQGSYSLKFIRSATVPN